jgi:glucoamylase
MPRDIPIGNGSLLITFEEDYCLRDIYYPHVGKENHSDGHKFRMGVWAEGKLWWIDRSWDLRLDYAPDTLSTQVIAGNQSLGAFLECNDLVDYRENIYLKKVLIKNSADRERELGQSLLAYQRYPRRTARSGPVCHRGQGIPWPGGDLH